MKILPPVPNYAWHFSDSLPWPILRHIQPSSKEFPGESENVLYINGISCELSPLNGTGFVYNLINCFPL